MSIRSLTSSVRPASGPPSARRSGSSSQVMPALSESAASGHEGISATASTSIRAPGITSAETSTSVEAGRGRAEDLLADRVHERPVVDVGEEHRHLDDVRERAAGRREHVAHVGKDGARLGDDVAAADELAARVDGDDAADEQQVARLDRVGEVRDRLGLARDAELAAQRHLRARRDAERTGGVERGRDGRVARAVADQHVDLEVVVAARDAADRPAARRSTRTFRAGASSRRAGGARRRPSPPPDHDDDGSVGRDPIRRDLAVARRSA